MGRIWRSLKLGMKSLLLHKLRSGLTVLGIVFGVAAVISMLAVGEGSSRDAQERFAAARGDQHHRPLGQADRGDRRPRADGRRAILNYGLKYEDYDRILATVPTIKKALPIREIRKEIRCLSHCLDGRVVGTTHDYAEFNRLEMEQGPVPEPSRTTSGTRTTPSSPRRPPRGSSPTRTRSASRSSSGPTTTRSSASPSERASSAGIGGSLAAQDFNKDVYIPLNTCKLRFGERIIEQPRRVDGGRGDAALADHAPGRQHRARSGRRPRSSSAAVMPFHPQEGRRHDRPLRTAAGGPGARPGSSASSWARSPRSRCWSAASAS